jgi:tartrate-resistant acid phosphatase type 5
MESVMTPVTRRSAIHGIVATAVAVSARPVFGIAPRASLDFLVLGDWGRNGTNHQRDVAVQMGRAGAKRETHCVVSVGDNFYENGVQSVDDPQWRSSFEDVYSAASLQVPWYVALGNHDYHGRPEAQVEYSAKSARWRMPTRYFTVLGSEVGAPYVDLFVIDTSPMVHKYRKEVPSAIAANVSTQDVGMQLQWLEHALNTSAAPWKLVFGHHTIYSGGSGHGDTPELIGLLEPVFRKHGVQAYFHGHDHDMQHIRRGSLNFVCCGAGSKVRPVEAIAGTQFCLSRAGFAAISVTSDALALEFRDYTGAKVYDAQIDRSGSAIRKAS